MPLVLTASGNTFPHRLGSSGINATASRALHAASLLSAPSLGRADQHGSEHPERRGNTGTTLPARQPDRSPRPPPR
jgi:hypothetical protein